MRLLLTMSLIACSPVARAELDAGPDAGCLEQHEPDGTIQTAAPLTQAGAVTGSWCLSGDVDIYSLELTAPGLTAAISSGLLSVLSSEGSPISQSSQSVDLGALPVGKYFIQATGSGGYELEVAYN